MLGTLTDASAATLLEPPTWRFVAPPLDQTLIMAPPQLDIGIDLNSGGWQPIPGTTVVWQCKDYTPISTHAMWNNHQVAHDMAQSLALDTQHRALATVFVDNRGVAVAGQSPADWIRRIKRWANGALDRTIVVDLPNEAPISWRQPTGRPGLAYRLLRGVSFVSARSPISRTSYRDALLPDGLRTAIRRVVNRVLHTDGPGRGAMREIIRRVRIEVFRRLRVIAAKFDFSRVPPGDAHSPDHRRIRAPGLLQMISPPFICRELPPA